MGSFEHMPQSGLGKKLERPQKPLAAVRYHGDDILGTAPNGKDGGHMWAMMNLAKKYPDLDIEGLSGDELVRGFVIEGDKFLDADALTQYMKKLGKVPRNKGVGWQSEDMVE